MTRKLLAFIAAIALTAGLSGPSRAEDMGALLTFTAHAIGTVNSADFNNARSYTRALSCVFNQSAHAGGTPSTVLHIQGKDTASGAYFDLIVSAAVTADTTPMEIAAGVGVAATANVSAGLPIPGTWRVQAVIGGSGTTTGTVGCSRSIQ